MTVVECSPYDGAYCELAAATRRQHRAHRRRAADRTVTVVPSVCADGAFGGEGRHGARDSGSVQHLLHGAGGAGETHRGGGWGGSAGADECGGAGQVTRVDLGEVNDEGASYLGEQQGRSALEC